MKIIFAGTSKFGIPTLEKLKHEHELVLIITQPDKPAGRNKTITPSPVKLWATRHNVYVEQPAHISDLLPVISHLNPDLMLVVAYGQIIPKVILNIPKFKSINIHGSLLPKYRGASPVQAAILNQEEKTGITLIQMDEKMDHGPIIAQSPLMLTGRETFEELYKHLADLSADMVPKVLSEWFAGKINPQVQNEEKATYTKLLNRNDGKINWAQSAKTIDAQIRALNPEPGTWTTLNGKIIKVLKAHIINDVKIELPGKIHLHQGLPAVKTLDASLLIEEIQPEGKSPMSGKDFINGLKSGGKLFI
ncbi:MAG: methionyl-tRNA formyltransferase [Candidatus Doudnabacteria bacterium RIFCSPLOWO2_02_FULL_42_9]|uniref:Methionyl-tRNA formyltransferase n=1 Tax=Candidatus Doudnabacteria bacterium RIFCSPHIGHO2_01_FULL_41_86 TaxID=1817821 RepID=A0A1F5N8L1_9BACT|nr:MAG: methionyl-tRNA formyltransferase [Candidatus Doudnabacteria bacterium RIFCSPHIGHO2_01_FULL_41_86]OGE75881.1 MAG: methionyl-tRNA formyltransferase [Candidatus Doudnabacteria bacterium RIFCSPHIGHO2_01_43_10]OGE86255.1 MAG: methionyl-tRNA formyltransferase [Candidatus Doudnabacteria bacterium RIFCSPHIGHO2_12_FULL_42_22]OGE87103.1 MAG: methionyl-tRNA formyltransferase [Candidatus Doudnabacteria bacterium RIFCSPHIGHO2_02_FULL_42_25]OGE92243.1 MAG: methionyl-tRNA formyltransferase [Candidatus